MTTSRILADAVAIDIRARRDLLDVSAPVDESQIAVSIHVFRVVSANIF